jgi:hypothetical protein
MNHRQGPVKIWQIVRAGIRTALERVPFALLIFACSTCIAALAGCSSSKPPSSGQTPPPSASAATNLSPQIRPAKPLPAPAQDVAASAVGPDQALLAGGLDARDTSRPNIDSLTNGSVVPRGRLPNGLHDAAAVTLGKYVYLFGGGGTQGGNERSSDRILRIDPTSGATSDAGKLPTPTSDLAAAVVGDTAYLVGGFTGSKPLNTIIAWRPGAPPQVVGTLPQPLRYAAVTAAQGKVIIAGGSAQQGASDAVQSFDPQTRRLSPLGRLPAPVTHASGATLANLVLIVGGRGDTQTSQTDAITVVNPISGQVTQSPAKLPAALSDIGAVSFPNAVVLVGGRSPKGPAPTVTDIVNASAPTPP